MSDSTERRLDEGRITRPTLAIDAIPAFEDNYIWLIHENGLAVVVDPGDAAPVRARLQAADLRLVAILLTHHHNDHVGGVAELVAATGAPVYGPANERLPHCDHPMREGDRVEIPELKIALHVLDVPGHTAGHIAYAGKVDGRDVVFCGDTLFSGGCGRLFEGMPADMHGSLAKLAALPRATLAYCAHEYTLSNLKWARAVDPGNAPLAGWQRTAEGLRAQQRPTLPTPIGVELAINPFLRTGDPTVRAAAEAHAGQALNDDVSVLATLRAWKNDFR